MVVLDTKHGRVIVLIEYVDRDRRFGNVRHIGSLDTQGVLLLAFVIQRLGQRNLPAEAIDAEHPIGIAAVGEIVRQCRVGIDVVGRDGRDNRSHFGSCVSIKFLFKNNIRNRKNNYEITFADADNAVWWKRRLIVIDVDNVDAQRAGARQLRRSFVGGYDSQPIEIANFTIKNYVGLDDAREWRLDDERVVVVAVHNVVDDVRIGAHISIRRRHLRRKCD